MYFQLALGFRTVVFLMLRGVASVVWWRFSLPCYSTLWMAGSSLFTIVLLVGYTEGLWWVMCDYVLPFLRPSFNGQVATFFVVYDV